MSGGSPGSGHRLVRFHPERNATLDSLRWARVRHHIPILMEVDVTDARNAIRAFRRRTGAGLSFTAWVVHCVARAASEHPRLHSLRKGRRRIMLFREVDVAVLVERRIGAGSDIDTLPMPFVVRGADTKSPGEVHEELMRAQRAEVRTGSPSMERSVPALLQSLFLRLPWWLRDLMFWRWLLRSPTLVKRTMGTVVVTSAGMATPGLLAWGIPRSLHPLAVSVGGVARRRTADSSREVLALTIAFDHAVTDGAPAGRFARRLHELMTAAAGIEERERARPGSLDTPCRPGKTTA